MTSADAAWLHMDRPTNLMVINSVLWCDEPIDWERCRDVFRERVVERFDRFRQRPVEGLTGPHWEDADLDLDLHFHHVALPAPGRPAALQEFVSDRLAQPLDRSRPLWEVYLIDGLGPGAAILVRMHHCIADGIALARVMLELADGGREPPARLPRRARTGPSRSASHAAARRGRAHRASATVLHPRDTRRHRGRGRADAREAHASGVGSRQRDQGRAARGTPGRVVASAGPLEASSAPREHSATTINDVLVSAVTGAVARAARRRRRTAGRGARPRPVQPPAARRAAAARAREPFRARGARPAGRRRRPGRAHATRSSAGWTRSSTATRARSRTGSSS